MADYAVMITTPSESYFLDAVDGFQVSSSNDMTSHPMVSGDVVADHIIVQPCSISFNGTVSLNSSSPVKSLSAIQKQFEQIKDDGILCTVAKVKTVNNEFRFLKRNNMVLTGIVWTENINSLDFSFTFQQVLLDNVQVTQVAEGKFLPDVAQPRTMTFQGTLISEEELYKNILNALRDSGIVDDQFLEQVSKSAVIGTIGGGLLFLGVTGYLTAAAAASTTAGLAAAAGASAMIPGAGWIVAGVIGAALLGFAIYNAISEGIEANKLKYKAFETDFDDYQKMREENERFAKMMDDVYTQVSVINDYYKCYGFDSDEPQECLLNIGGTYHSFTFTRNNVNTRWHCTISAFENGTEIQKRSKDITFAAEFGNQSAADAFYTYYANDATYYVYFVGGVLTKSIMIVSTIEPCKFTEELQKVVDSALYV